MKKYNTLRAVAIALELGFAAWHIYMQRRIYKPLLDSEMRRRNPRGASLLYISLAHLPNNLWFVAMLATARLPVWLLLTRATASAGMIVAIDNYLRQYTGSTFWESVKRWTKRNRKPNGA